MTAANRWDHLAYQRISGANYDEGRLVVTFEDGSRANPDIALLLPAGAEGAHWNSMTVTPYEIQVQTDKGQVEIAWSAIRVLTDIAYSNHLVAAATEQACEIGARLKYLREARGFSSKELAERAGITTQSLSQIERGHHASFSILQRILAAMGCSLKELAIPAHEHASADPRP